MEYPCSARTSAPLVKVINPIWSIKSDRVNLVAPASPVHRAYRYSTSFDRKGWSGSEIQMSGLISNLGIEKETKLLSQTQIFLFLHFCIPDVI